MQVARACLAAPACLPRSRKLSRSSILSAGANAIDCPLLNFPRLRNRRTARLLDTRPSQPQRRSFADPCTPPILMQASLGWVRHFESRVLGLVFEGRIDCRLKYLISLRSNIGPRPVETAARELELRGTTFYLLLEKHIRTLLSLKCR